MKPIHFNKVAAIAQVKTKAFMGKNCIIMPAFSIGFTFIMRILYENMDLAFFTLVSVLASLTSCIIGMLLGIFSKNQVSAGTITSPVLLALMMIPMFSNFIDGLDKISEFFFTGIIMDLISNISSKSDTILDLKSILILVIEVILSVVLFIFFYQRNGFEKD